MRNFLNYMKVLKMNSKFNDIYNNIIWNSNLLQELKRLENFQYGCLFEDGKILIDQQEISKRPFETLIIQTPEMFLKNKIGMCHDATIYVDKICNQNFINHKCIYLSSNTPPEYKTHSFIVVQLNNKKWQVIDVFATKNCIWGEQFNTYSEAIDNRIDKWILIDNHGFSDVQKYIGNTMLEAGCNFADYYHKLIKTFRVYYTEIDLKETYSYNEKLLTEQKNNMFIKTYNKCSYSCIDYDDIICETSYFNDIPQQLEDFIINKIYQNINNQEYFIQIPISKIAEILLNNKIKNYRCFHNFLKLLRTNVNGFLDIKFVQEDSSFIPPVEISKIKISNNENLLHIKSTMTKLDLIIADYHQFLLAKTKNIKHMNDVYKRINNEIKYRDTWGEIGINGKYITIDKQNLSIVIDHQLGHFISFLIRVSGENHQMCRYQSNYHHEEYNNTIPSEELANYLLDSDQFKRLSDTYIQRICNVFENNSQDFSRKNIMDFYNYIISLIKQDKNYKIKNQKNEEILKNMFNYIDILRFMKIVYQDSLNNKDQKQYRNNFTVFKKWLLHSLLKLKDIGE